MEPTTLHRGDYVEITSQGTTIRGIVESAHNYGTPEEPDWYIEFESHYGLHYWKQGIDGGTVVVIQWDPS